MKTMKKILTATLALAITAAAAIVPAMAEDSAYLTEPAGVITQAEYDAITAARTGANNA